MVQLVVNPSGHGVFETSLELLRNRNVRVLAITGFVSGLYIGMLNGVLQLFPGSLGLSVAVLGTLQTLGNRFNGISATLAQPLAGHYTDIRGRRRMVILGSVMMIASMMSFAWSAASKELPYVVIAFVLFGAATLASPATQAMIADTVSADEGRLKVAYSLVFFLNMVPGAFTPYIAGVLAGQNGGYLVVFLVGVSLECFNLILYVRELRDVPPSAVETNRVFSIKEAFRFPKGYLGIFLTFAVDSFSFGISSTIIYAIMRERLNISTTEVGVVVSVLSLSIIVSQYPATRILLAIGARRTIAISEALTLVVVGGWAVATSFPAFVVLSVVFGLSVATWVPGVQSMLMVRSASEERGSIGGKVSAFRGAISFPAPLLGGLLYQDVAYQAPMVASFVGAAVAVVMILKFIPGEG